MLGDRFKKLRSEKKLTQEELAAKIGVTRGTYAHYEINKRQPDYETLIKIADFFEVSTDYLLKGEDFHQQAKKILEDTDTQIAARDGDITDSEAIERIARILEKQRGRVPGQRQQKPK